MLINPTLQAAVSDASPTERECICLKSVFLCALVKHRSFSSLERPVTVLYMSTSWCAVLSGETKQLAVQGSGSVLKY